jgi:hypothetical protein
MRNQVLYASVIFTISTLLIGVGMFSADAARGGEETTTQKGNGVDVSGDGFQLVITPNENSKYYTVNVAFENSDGLLERAICKTVSDKLVKIAALKKATIEFNTASLGTCSSAANLPISSHVDISINFFNAEPVEDESNFEKGPNCDGNGNCSHEVGTTKTANGEVTITLGDDEAFTGDGKLFVTNTKVTYWTE